MNQPSKYNSSQKTTSLTSSIDLAYEEDVKNLVSLRNEDEIPQKHFVLLDDFTV